MLAVGRKRQTASCYDRVKGADPRRLTVAAQAGWHGTVRGASVGSPPIVMELFDQAQPEGVHRELRVVSHVHFFQRAHPISADGFYAQGHFFRDFRNRAA